MKFCTAAEMRRLDEKTIKECGIPGVVLMENAGRGAAVLTREYFGDLTGRGLAVVCGRGNNGGDGFVMARIFHGWGASVRVFLLSNKEKVGGDAKVNMDVVANMGLEIVEIANDSDLERLTFSESDIIVDAILGTGLSSEVRGLYRDVIIKINDSERPVVSVDVPSGVDSDAGAICGVAVKADLTVTFGLPKIGLLTPPGEDMAGRLEVVDIGIPPHILEEADPGKELLIEESMTGLIEPREKTGHKGRYGHVLIAAGSTGKTGAAAMAASAAARSGAGLVTLAVPASLNPVLEQKLTEVMTEPLAEEMPGFLAAESADRILDLAEGKSVLAIGPGLGARPGAAELVEAVVKKCGLPIVIDADGLNALVGNTGVLKKARREIVLTPHPGEMARLTGKTVAQVQADRLGAAAEFSKRYSVITVLKGYRTIIAEPGGVLYMNTTGGPHMASGGMGDVLTGVIAGLVAQGLSVLDAARLGVYVHGLAADEAAEARGAIGILASDLIDLLPGLLTRFYR